MSAHDTVPNVDGLYRDHHGWLTAWLNKRLGNVFDAADLAHDTFMRILLKDATFSIQEPRALLTTVAQGIVANFHRRRDIEKAYLEALAQLPEAQVPSPETRMIMLETLIALDNMLNGLPRVTKEAFLLSQLEGLRQADIATQLSISVPTVKRHIARALAQCAFWSDEGM